MPSWIVRILFSPAAPIAALPVSRDSLNTKSMLSKPPVPTLLSH